jgi:hypothetical protein
MHHLDLSFCSSPIEDKANNVHSKECEIDIIINNIQVKVASVETLVFTSSDFSLNFFDNLILSCFN